MSWSLFRICSTVTAVLLLDQAVFAGQFLSGSFGALHTHRENATYAGLAALLTAVTGLLARWRGGGPWWPAVLYGGLFLLVAAQIALGFARLLTVHIPLGAAIIALAAGGTVRAWRTRPQRHCATSGDHSEPDRIDAGAVRL
ncbi:hypothetical protein ACWEOZ_18060 [Actinoplanes sp. NPDC004185]